MLMSAISCYCLNGHAVKLVQSTYGMTWVIMSRIAQSRIKATLFMMNYHRRDKNNVNPATPDLKYCITCFDSNNELRTKSRTTVGAVARYDRHERQAYGTFQRATDLPGDGHALVRVGRLPLNGNYRHRRRRR
ncbi:unnamed protein product [Aphis gossypii]|uniref:Uncharacterized protein n=1 Tax=Aphis gossypii TaxID=80765 RepID=A0A9P0J320_APHGO|nr:unnamed protein product [Aphis gossypii]